ncbi:MAG: D-cysteine desulfhydrase, partial [Woeseiaceae bacterium]
MLLSDFPRAPLAHLPTPLEHMPRLSKVLGGPEIYVKRDDCTGLATGGNKTRKLEYSMGEALQKGADTIITVGAVQSNHVRQTVAAACKLGLKCEVVLERRVQHPSDLYRNSGNVLLDRIFGANLREYDDGTDFDVEMAKVADVVRSGGGVPYIIPGGASNPIGALGYVGCGVELLQQFSDRGLEVDHIVTATGSAGTHAGLAVGLRGSGSDLPILGIGVQAPKEKQEYKVYQLACQTADFVGAPGAVARDDIIADCNYVGPGYGEPTDSMNEAVLMLARLEGLLFDPVYTGKALAGMIDYVRNGRFNDAGN